MNLKKQHMGIMFIVASAFCFSLMGLFVRLAGDLPSVEKGFFRNIVAAVFAFVIIIKEKNGFRFSIKNLPLLRNCRHSMQFLRYRQAGPVGCQYAQQDVSVFYACVQRAAP